MSWSARVSSSSPFSLPEKADTPTLAFTVTLFPSYAKGSSTNARMRSIFCIDVSRKRIGFDKQHEFVTAKTDDRIVGSDLAQKTSGGDLENKIPGGMPERIVNGLEVIKVNEDDVALSP